LEDDPLKVGGAHLKDIAVYGTILGGKVHVNKRGAK